MSADASDATKGQGEVKLHTKVGDHEGEPLFDIRNMRISESLSQPYRLEIDLQNRDFKQVETSKKEARADAAVKYEFKKIVGQSIAVELPLGNGGSETPRYFHGVVAAVFHEDKNKERSWDQYRVVVVPTLWFLSKQSNCRIFQNKTVKQIVDSVLEAGKVTDKKWSIEEGDYQVREYCVQYRETDLNFIHRLLEEEGIFYYFVHEEAKHTLVLADDVKQCQQFGQYDTIRYDPTSDHGKAGDDDAQEDGSVQGQDKFGRIYETLLEWSTIRETTSSKHTLDDFDYKNPSGDLTQSNEDQKGLEQEEGFEKANREIYDYPGSYASEDFGKRKSVATRFAKIRHEEEKSYHARVRAKGNVRGISAGYIFKLDEPTDAGGTKLPGKRRRDSENDRHWVVVSARIQIQLPDVTLVGGTFRSIKYSVEFEAMSRDMQYRPARVTPKPVVAGPQTATVVGGQGDEIYTDSDGYGRIKVRFHWDRQQVPEGQPPVKAEESSCWVRVAQTWAGPGYGTFMLPRVGNEVVISFLEGDPDRPLCTGSVYNGQNKWPVSLPDAKTQSGIVTLSSKGGQAGKDPAKNSNWLIFEDKKDSELIDVNAEKDLTVNVEHDEKRSVGSGQAGGNYTLTVSKDGQGGGKYSLTAAEEISIVTGKSKIVMKKDGTITITGVKLTIESVESGQMTLSVAQGPLTLKTEQDKLSTKAMSAKHETTTQMEFSASTNLNLSATANFAAKGMKVDVNADGMMNLQASGIAALKGSMTNIG